MRLARLSLALIFSVTLGLSHAAAHADDVPADIAAFAKAAVSARDVLSKPFAVIDKPRARLWVFDANARLMAQTPVLVGAAVGDTAPHDIGTRPLALVKPHEKITPSGRFMSEPGRNTKGEDIIWIDYDSAVSMHRVRNVPRENRVQRLATETVADNRISFGCVNIPPSFYDHELKPYFGVQTGVVYVLPENVPPERVFAFLR